MKHFFSFLVLGILMSYAGFALAAEVSSSQTVNSNTTVSTPSGKTTVHPKKRKKKHHKNKETAHSKSKDTSASQETKVSS